MEHTCNHWVLPDRLVLSNPRHKQTRVSDHEVSLAEVLDTRRYRKPVRYWGTHRKVRGQPHHSDVQSLVQGKRQVPMQSISLQLQPTPPDGAHTPRSNGEKTPTLLVVLGTARNIRTSTLWHRQTLACHPQANCLATNGVSHPKVKGNGMAKPKAMEMAGIKAEVTTVGDRALATPMDKEMAGALAVLLAMVTAGDNPPVRTVEILSARVEATLTTTMVRVEIAARVTTREAVAMAAAMVVTTGLDAIVESMAVKQMENAKNQTGTKAVATEGMSQ
eukprot:GHVU01154456.1.p2 GENE.GHVU01154456.1~~GHVU01154456.1.p2  ORF type:complete len:276 (+),score=19.96 GHVU01154456.1:538-1365(+)